ncbi:hypothetical protein ACJBLD_19570 [Acinetobacter nosocomialis]|uniref:hypothetical protein n=1 Tax=Acinetobacter nosocomialis TaxID=106654 RepID=UPI003862B338
MDKFEEYFRTTERYQDFLCWGLDKWIFKSFEGRYISEEIQRLYEVWQHQQAKVEELQVQLKGAEERAQLTLKYKDKYREERDELQKRVDELEKELGAWKGKSIAAMINGMCGQCGKEPWQAIRSDKEGCALLHCFGCGANKYELIGEKALKGEG